MATGLAFALVVVDDVLGVVERQIHLRLVVLVDLDRHLVGRLALVLVAVLAGFDSVCASTLDPGNHAAKAIAAKAKPRLRQFLIDISNSSIRKCDWLHQKALRAQVAP